MPVTSHQISGMMAGQQAMFGNMATYAQQISPFGQKGLPSYAASNPGGIAPTTSEANYTYNQGAAMAPGMLNAAGSFAAPMIAGAGMMMGGPLGGMMDPFTGGMRGLGAGVGWQRGGGFMANMGRVAGGGFGGLARGVGMGALGALPGLAIGGAIQYGAGQMIEGAQFQNQVSSSLQNNFRFTNPASESGYGFNRTGQRQIGRMMQEMGTQDVMTTPGELLGIMQQGTQMGVFRGVREAREFKEKFKQMKESLKEIAGAFNTTLSDAMPFFQSARQQGFWTPQDITRHANQVKAMQANTGMSTQQAQQVTMMGAQMVRAIGGTGQQGAQMMARAQGMTGAALAGGTITDQSLGEAGFGTGAEGAQNLGTMLAGATTRFARSRVGRWGLAAMMNKAGTGLDPGRMQEFMAGGMSVGRMGSLARKNVSGGRAYDFVNNEEEMRGQLAAQGPMAGLGMVRGILGGRLYSGSSRDKLIANRMIRRFVGGNKRQAEIIKKMAQEMPRLMEIQAATTEAAADAQERQQQEAMNDTWEGMKRKVGTWWEQNVTGAMKKAGADFSTRVGRAWNRFSDKLWGTGGRSVHLQDSAVRAMSTAALTGDMSGLNMEFGRAGGMASRMLAGMGEGQRLAGGQQVGMAQTSLMGEMGFQATGAGRTGSLLGGLGMEFGATFSEADKRRFGSMTSAMGGGVGNAAAEAAGYGSTESFVSAKKSEGAKGIEQYMKGAVALQIAGKFGAKPSNEDKIKMARIHAKAIRSGAAGEAARQMLEGVDEQTAITRVVAMQGGAKGGSSGIQLDRPGGQFADMTDAQLEDISTNLDEQMATDLRGGVMDDFLSNVIGGAGIAAMGGIKGVAVTNEGMKELSDNPDAQRAYKLMAESADSTNKEEKARLKKEAYAALALVGNDKNVSEAARSAAIALTKGNNDAQMAAKGAVQQAANQKKLGEVVVRRADRIKRKLGDRLSEVNKIADQVKGGALRSALDNVLNPSADDTAQDRIGKMQELAKLAAENPKEAGRIRGILAEEGAGTSGVGQLLSGALETAVAVEKGAVKEGDEARLMGGRGPMSRARLGVGGLLGGMGLMPKDKGDLDRLIRGGKVGKAAQDRLRKGLEDKIGMSADQAGAFIKDIQGGLTKKEMIDRGSRAATAKGLRSTSEAVAREAGLKPDVLNLTGKEGSPEEMGKQMKIQTHILRDIAISAAKSAKRESGVVNQGKKSVR